MSTKADLENNQKSYIRRVNKNKNTLSVSIPIKFAKLSKIKSEDYLVCELELEDSRNKLTFTKINFKEDK